MSDFFLGQINKADSDRYNTGIIIAIIAGFIVAVFFGYLLLNNSVFRNSYPLPQNTTAVYDPKTGPVATVEQIIARSPNPTAEKGSGISDQRMPVSETWTSKTIPPLQTRGNDTVFRSFTWMYNNVSWTLLGDFSRAAYNYYRARPHNRENNYAEYVLSDYDRQMLNGVIRKFRDVGAGNGYSEYDNVMNIAAFVQSMHYTSDSVTTGYDEYPRYPLETLVDDGGDCEDTAILTAALIKELGYRVVLIQLPGHMAVGVEGSDSIQGTYYEYNKSRYYYLETTGAGWDLGELPKEYLNSTATLLPLVQRPRMDMSCGSPGERSDGWLVYLTERCSIQNIGVGTAKNPKLYVAALAINRGNSLVWQPDTTVILEDYPEGAIGSGEALVRIPRNETVRIRYYLSGDNFEPVELLSPQFTT